MNNITRLIASGAIAAFALTGCGASGGSNAPAPNTIAPVSTNVLQFAAGTVNFQGASTGLNVVTTYRQSNGDSGTLVNSPTLTVPAALPAAGPATGMFNTQLGAAGETTDACSTILFGPSANEAGTTAAVSTSQSPGSTAITTFGQSGGVFGIGIEPFNSTGQGDCTPAAVNATGTPFQAQPYPIPVYDAATGTDPNQIPAGWGGPPAFSISGSSGESVIGNSNYPDPNCPADLVSGSTLHCYAGLSLGIDAFMGVAPVAHGAYTLAISIPANTGTTTKTVTFTMPALTTLPTIVAPPAYVPDVAGGGTFAFVMPAGATEALLEVIDYGADNGPSCNGAGTADTNPATGNAAAGVSGGEAIYYTIEATASGTLTLPDTIGPGGAPSVCTAAQNTAVTPGTDADQIAIQVIAVDYPLYEANPINSAGKQSPTIVGAGGSADMTISPAVCQQGAGACVDALPLLRLRNRGIHLPNSKIRTSTVIKRT